MSAEKLLALILLMGLASYLPRCLPLVLLTRRRIPDWLKDWLDFIPAAIMASLLGPALFVQDGAVSLGKAEFWVAIPTLLFALKTRSLGGTLVVGMALFWLTGLWRG